MAAADTHNRTIPGGIPFTARNPGALAAVVVAILAITAFLLVLAINRIQTTLLEADAEAQGRSWSSALLSTLESMETVFQSGALSQKDRATIALASRIGGLEKFIIFNAQGVAVAASDPADVGTVNRSGYWADSVLRGEIHATIERAAAGETGEIGPGDALVVAETYVPVFSSGGRDRRVIGAFETYLDVTQNARSYARIGFYASAAGIALIAAAAVLAVAFARRTLTYRLEREEMLAEARQVAESASRAKSSFLATVSHEIRTPMTGILATIELLERSKLDSAQKGMAGVVRRSASSLLGLLNQLLDQSKIEAGKLDIQPRVFAFADPVTDVMELFLSAANAKGVTLTGRIDGAIPQAVVGDGDRIEQILANLVGNALKFTEAGSIVVSAVRVSEGRVRIDVTDTGIGIAPDALSRLFDPFEQADAGTTRRFGGTGLGLTVSRQLAELMGGTLTADSTPGRGSTFSLELPLPAARIEEAQAVTASSGPSAGLRVLVAEDDATLRWVIGQQLERIGCTAQVVMDGAAALSRWQADPAAWDLIITDWHMPALDGLGLLRALRDSGQPHPPVVMLTASGLPEEIETARLAGASQVLVKPVQLNGLAAALAAAMAATERGDRPSADAQAVEAVNAAVLDTSDLEELTGGDPAMVNHLLDDFADRLAGDRERLESSDEETRRGLAHALRGASAAIGAAALADACAELERGDGAVAWAEFERAADALADVLKARRNCGPGKNGDE